MPTTAAHKAATVASAPVRLANGFCHLPVGAAGLSAVNGNALGAASPSPRNPPRIRSGVSGNSQKRNPVSSKITMAIAAALRIDADSPPPTAGRSEHDSVDTAGLV